MRTKMASKGMTYAIVGVIIIIVAVGGYYVWTTMQAQPGGGGGGGGGNPVAVTIYGGEVSSSVYGWSMTSTGLKSPGPTLNMTVGTSYTVTFKNVGSFPHAWAVKQTNDPNAATVWGAAVGSSSAPISPNGSGSVTFTPTAAGTYYYLCPVPGHDTLGMYGIIKVS